MTSDHRRNCPSWCVADHAAEDEAGPALHRGATVVVPGIAIRTGPQRTVDSIEILIELHSNEGDPVVGIYVGDGQRGGLDITTETADRLVRRLIEALRVAGAVPQA